MNTLTPSMPGFHHLADWSHDRLQALLDRAAALRNGAPPQRHPGRALGLLFLNPSLRTSASFQRAASLLGMDLVQLSGDGVWGLEYADGVIMDGSAAEHLREAAPVLGRYVDFLAVRAFPAGRDLTEDLGDPVLHAFHRWSGVPVINMESCRWHPCQALADWATLEQHRIPPRGRLVLTWAWHPKALPHAVANSTLCMAAQRGMDVVLLHPPSHPLHADVIAEAEALATVHGGSLTVTQDRTVLGDADVVYAKSWGSLECWGDAPAESARRADLRDWCVTTEQLGPHTHFMHCLPVRRNVVVSDAVLDSPRSLVLDQAENRLYAQTALLEELNRCAN